MNEIVNKCLLANSCLKCIEDSEALHTKLVDHLQNTKKEYKNLKKLEIHNIFIKMNQINLQTPGMAYGDFKDLTTRTASDIILCYKAFNIAKNHKHD